MRAKSLKETLTDLRLEISERLSRRWLTRADGSLTSGARLTGPASARKAGVQETAVHAESSCGAQEHSLRSVGVHVVLVNGEESVLRTVPRLQLPRHAK